MFSSPEMRDHLGSQQLRSETLKTEVIDGNTEKKVSMTILSSHENWIPANDPP
jgi:hypothetical protein